MLGLVDLPNVVISSIDFIPVKSNPLFKREKVIKTSVGAIQSLEEVVAQTGSAGLTPDIIIQTAPDLMSYSSQNVTEIQVVNGWSEVKMAFTLIAYEEDNNGRSTIIIDGYTDKYDVSLNGIINPDTILIFDTVTTTYTSKDVNGNYLDTRLVSSITISTDLLATPHLFGNNGGNQLVANRPEDIILGLGAAELNVDSAVGIVATTNINDSATAVKHTHLNPISLISEVLKGNQISRELDFNTTKADQLMNGIGFVKTPNLNSNPFFTRLISDLGMHRISNIEYGDICRIFPNADNVATIAKRGDLVVFGMDGDHLGHINIEASLANAFIDTILSFLREYKLNSVSFEITNKTHDGQAIHKLLSNIGSYIPNIDLIKQYGFFIQKVIHFAFPLVHQNKFNVELLVDVTPKLITIAMHIDGSDMKRYQVPMLSYGLTIPAVANTDERNKTVGSLLTLTNLIEGGQNNDTVTFI